MLTTAANQSAHSVHHRMSVIIPHQQIPVWLGSSFEQTANFLSSQQPELSAVAV
ncbi:SOS response-associated peptidase [Acetanaerobacterium sp. MSJ-12]|nr:SOS response-associated peptidase family protein [Bittarella massiliensis (ex Durand et al. 2017)]MBU5420000.1 SOS response-associated peptidase [Acetanaerobacterium sp. MSJ-12]